MRKTIQYGENHVRTKARAALEGSGVFGRPKVVKKRHRCATGGNQEEALGGNQTAPAILPYFKGGSAHTFILNSAPLSMLRTLSLPPMLFSMIDFDMNKPIPVPCWEPLVVK
jgi:hypothetical protein